MVGVCNITIIWLSSELESLQRPTWPAQFGLGRKDGVAPKVVVSSRCIKFCGLGNTIHSFDQKEATQQRFPKFVQTPLGALRPLPVLTHRVGGR